MGQVHQCGTTHCRAGWAVHLAGEAGYDLERRFDWNLAARMIYEASGYKISPVEFYKSNDDALADMKRLADDELARTVEKEVRAGIDMARKAGVSVGEPTAISIKSIAPEADHD